MYQRSRCSKKCSVDEARSNKCHGFPLASFSQTVQKVIARYFEIRRKWRKRCTRGVDFGRFDINVDRSKFYDSNVIIAGKRGKARRGEEGETTAGIWRKRIRCELITILDRNSAAVNYRRAAKQWRKLVNRFNFKVLSLVHRKILHTENCYYLRSVTIVGNGEEMSRTRVQWWELDEWVRWLGYLKFFIWTFGPFFEKMKSVRNF